MLLPLLILLGFAAAHPLETPSPSITAVASTITAPPDPRLALEARTLSTTSISYPPGYHAPPGFWGVVWYVDWIPHMLEIPATMNVQEWRSAFSYSLYYAPNATGCVPTHVPLNARFVTPARVGWTYGPPPRCPRTSTRTKKTRTRWWPRTEVPGPEKTGAVGEPPKARNEADTEDGDEDDYMLLAGWYSDEDPYAVQA
ncbi:hypothetical protein CC85DRAFT_311385 [Cutaneotrichosporon oleaginosum]|uniref:Uncharacterized protein n=1 Tax=Cutaneotrichosporon oleaginosum TaxID=879819 RepID=A0A0J0XSI0_9TREE|nr:uncharacterized protein CC85DRAFT_311385 [Cutaneotrichosporon oleaginosum]KLT44046.1 hypothetical protein CC85DRAFT_311385 [Cutaneotrichosporon oleaginosum]